MNNHNKTLPALIMLTLLYVCITASGRDVTVRTPGTLHTTIKSNEKYKISELKIEGALNSADIMMLRDMAGCDAKEQRTEGRLKRIDMTGVTFVKDITPFIENNKSSIINDIYTLPAYMISN